MLSDIIAGNRLRHPYVRFTLWNAPDLAPDLDERLHYHDPGLHLRYPPDWADLTQTTEAAHEGGFNLTIPVRLRRCPLILVASHRAGCVAACAMLLAAPCQALAADCCWSVRCRSGRST